MSPSEAIENLETYGRHLGNGLIAINHDRSCELLLKNAVIVLQDARMIERDAKIGAIKIINRDAPRVEIRFSGERDERPFFIFAKRQ